MNDSRILVTGGAGFIGSNLVEHLICDNNEIIVLDNLSTGNLTNIQSFIDNQSIHFEQGDITNYSLVDDLLEKYNIEYIFHLAAQVSVPQSITHPKKTHDININGTFNILQAAKKHHVKKVIFSSSCAIYGNNHQKNAIKETDKPQPLNPYSLSKLIGEQYCSLYASCYDVPCISLRYFNVYGPKQDPSGQYAAVIPKFIERLQTKKAPIIYGDGQQTRDFVYVKDVVKANLLAAENEKCGIFNIATGEQTSINDLADHIMKASGDNQSPIYKPSRTCEIFRSIADISKAHDTLSYDVTYPLKAGIERTIEWFTKK